MDHGNHNIFIHEKSHHAINFEKSHSAHNAPSPDNGTHGSLEHQKYHEKHKGHEQMHAEMFLILLGTLVLAHIALTIWKKRHFRSYQAASLVGLLIIPVAMSISHAWYRFVIIWSIFCILTSFVILKGMQKPVTVTTPRMVYKYFYGVHLLSGFFSISGYCMLLFGIFGLNLLFFVDQKTWFDIGLHLLFYGFYYGVIGRDLADVITHKMALHIGYYSSDGMPSKKLDARTCALCGNQLLVPAGEEVAVEKTYRLSCGHQFHEFCLRGWCIVGKKEVCPYCKERFSMKTVYQNPWDRPHVLLGQYLDVLRYMLAWQPLILYSDQIIYNVLGLS